MKTEEISIGKLLKLGLYVLVIYSLLLLIRTQGRHLTDQSAQQIRTTQSAIA